MTQSAPQPSDARFGLEASEVAERLREHGIRPTAQRVEIGMVLLARPQHLSAEVILAQVNELDPKVSKATVYNTLGLFCRRGLVRELFVGGSKVFYDSDVSKHFHLYDVDSGELVDISTESVRIAGLPELPSGVEFEGLDVIVRVRNAGT